MAAPRIGTNGTNGVLKGRLMVGFVLRSTIIEIHTITKAINVPIDTNSPHILMDNMPAMRAEPKPVTIVDL